MSAPKLGRRAVLRGAPAAIAAAAMTVPIIAAASDAGADARLFELEAQWQAALRVQIAAHAKHEAIRGSLPEWAFNEPAAPPDGDDLFMGVKRKFIQTGATRLERLGRYVITMEAIREFNNNTETCIEEWRDMPPGPKREDWRKEWIRRRTEGRQRVQWWQAKKREQQAMIAASGEREAAHHADRTVGVVADIEDLIKVAPVTTMAGLAVKLRVLAAWATLHGERPEEEIEWDDDLTRVILADAERLAGSAAAEA